MKVIVTGGLGFIGRSLVDQLAAGHDVIVLDNLSTSCRRPEEVHDLIVHDVRKPFPITAPLIYHLACPASPDEFYRDPWGVFETCVLGTLNALEALEPGGRFVLASSSEIYGHQYGESGESDVGNVDPVGPRSCYQEGKRAAEAATANFMRRHEDRSAVIARLFNIYGPRMPQDGRVVRTLIDAASTNFPLCVFGDGSQTRTFLYVDDCIEALCALASSASSGHMPRVEVVNIGGNETISISDLAVLVCENMKTRSRIACDVMPLRGDEPKCRKPSIEKIRKLCNWEPKTSLTVGLRKTIEGTYSRGCLR